MILIATLALAAASLDTPAFTRCMDRAGGVTTLMRNCMAAEHTRWDARLNGSYQKLMATSAPAAREALRQEERTWIVDRKTRCDHAGDAEAGGTMQALEIDGCYLEQTQKRAAKLERR